MKIIETREISKVYRMGNQTVNALQSISISIDRGEYVAFMGPSGSGKSTLMNIVGCLDTPSSGSYMLNNKLVSEMTENELADTRNKEIGFVFQTFNLLPRASALENVALPLIYAGYSKSERNEMALQALGNVGLAERSHHRPNELSGGQRQRVAIARALIAEPRILILDDATSSVDARTEAAIKRGLREVMEGRTTFVVAHRLSTISLADEIVVMDGGTVVDRGSHDELLERCPLYAEIAEHGMEDSVFLQRDLEQREEVARL
jgi:putative ABC transport system ATP-binding protein